MTKLNSREITNLLENLIGGVRACGETYTDEKIKNNLKTLIDVVNWGLEEVRFSSETMGRDESSMHEVGFHARSALMEWYEWLGEVLDEVTE